MNNKQNYPRTFLSIVPPENIKKKLQEQIHLLKSQPHLEGVKWYESTKLHITLQFLGNLSFDDVLLLSTQLTPIIQTIPAFEIALGNIVIFPSLRHPKVIAFDVLESSELLSLVAVINKIAASSGLGKPDFPFNGHLTLGRLPHSCFNFESNKIVDSIPDLHWLASTIYLMESIIENNRSRYVELAEFQCT